MTQHKHIRLLSAFLALLLCFSGVFFVSCQNDKPAYPITTAADTTAAEQTSAEPLTTQEETTAAVTEAPAPEVKKTAVIIGGGPGTTITKAIAELAGKENPKILLVPTAKQDAESTVTSLTEQFKPYSNNLEVLYLLTKKHDAEELRQTILSADIIYVAGGTTQLLMTIWKKYNVDDYMREAYEAGVILSGSSAGAICWTFKGFNDFSSTNYDFCQGIDVLHVYFGPHFQDADFAGFEAKLLATEPEAGITNGYALENGSALIFENGESRAVRESRGSHIYEFTYADGKWGRTEYNYQ